MNHHQHHHHNHQFPTPPPSLTPPFGGGQGGMKKSPSEQALADLINHTCTNENNNNNSNNNNNNMLPVTATPGCGGAGLLHGCLQQQLDVSFDNPTAATAIEDNLSFSFKHDHHYDHHQDMMNEFGGITWNQNFPSPQSCISATIDSPISMCAGSPTSILTVKAGDNQGSGSSEDEDGETKAGLENQSNNPDAIKRLRRMESNRDSARRSRRRKQEQLQVLENQVDELAEENMKLFKQLGDAAQQLREATTNNRVLKSDVEALRAKVNLAADRVKRGTMSPALNHIFQAQLAATTQLLNPQPVARAGSIGFQGPDNTATFGGLFPAGIAGPNNINVDVHVGDHILHGNNNNNNAENPNNNAEIWTWDSDQVCGLPK